MKSRLRTANPGSQLRQILRLTLAIRAGNSDWRNGDNASFCGAETLSLACLLWVAISGSRTRSRTADFAVAQTRLVRRIENGSVEPHSPFWDTGNNPT
jgi:hypothetical protein